MGLPSADARGHEAKSLTHDLLEMAPDVRREWYRSLPARDMGIVMTRCRLDVGSSYGLWQDDPRGFIEDVCGDTLYSKQVEVIESVRDHVRTAAPSTHAAAKSFTGGRLVVWWTMVWPLGTALAITTAPKMRQVKNVMWPEIRRAVRAGKLPGTVQTTQWKIDGEVRAYGFSAADYDEDAVQGIHATHVLFIVDEAGGISHSLGRSYAAVLSQYHARELLIGNPPTDEEGSWFEDQAEKTEELVNTVRIPASSTPNFTGEKTGRCTTCPPAAPPHRIAMHLTSHEWVEEAVAEFGLDSAFVEARVHARFPHAVGSKVIPYDWVEAAAEKESVPAAGHWVRLGADIASDGGDEFVIAQAVGFSVRLVHRSSGAANADPVNVAGRITEQAREACEVRDRVGDERPVHVKIDASGLGWGVAGLVKRQCEEMGLPVNVFAVRAEGDPNDESHFRNIRSEMWWNTRRLMQPTTDPITGAVTAPGKVKLIDAPTRLLAQLSAPKYDTDSAGRTVVEKKSKTKSRVGGSPDLADALNLALYEPPAGGPLTVEAPAPAPMPTRASQMQGGGGGAQVIPLGPRGQ